MKAYLVPLKCDSKHSFSQDVCPLNGLEIIETTYRCRGLREDRTDALMLQMKPK